MTPQQIKAKDLVEKFRFKRNDDFEEFVAKQCAIIAVNEILEIVSSDDSILITELQWWQQVKEEINKI